MSENFDFIEMKLPAKAEYVGVVRLSLSGIANRMGFSFEDIEDLKVAVSEAITNAVTHAYEEEEGEISIGFGIYDDRLEVTVADHGASFKMSEIKDKIGPQEETDSIEDVKEGGFGLFLIKVLMDKVKINNDYGVVVFMTKYVNEIEVGMDDDQISTTK